MFAGFCGGSHDSYVLQNLQLYLDHKEDIKNWFASPEYHLVGDCAYPLMSYLLKPFPETTDLSEAKKNYNKSLSGCHYTIERAFGLLKNKWKILTKASTNDPEKMTILTCACCVLHNFCIMHGAVADVDDFVNKPTSTTQRSHNVGENDEFVLSSVLAVSWPGVDLDRKEKESRILKGFEKC